MNQSLIKLLWLKGKHLRSINAPVFIQADSHFSHFQLQSKWIVPLCKPNELWAISRGTHEEKLGPGNKQIGLTSPDHHPPHPQKASNIYPLHSAGGHFTLGLFQACPPSES